ncbi:hypothetical protein QIU18_07020 [Capnocytophaga canimorsus]|nr:hypothetical protein [Capnocytophaga canimorsus]WGU71501.1 hypothetical protein QIU18_07020 [Capnocytophaga canimorsus]
MLNPDYKLMLIAWLGVALWVGFVIFSNRKIHPKALFYSFYGGAMGTLQLLRYAGTSYPLYDCEFS